MIWLGCPGKFRAAFQYTVFFPIFEYEIAWAKKFVVFYRFLKILKTQNLNFLFRIGSFLWFYGKGFTLYMARYEWKHFLLLFFPYIAYYTSQIILSIEIDQSAWFKRIFY